MPALSFRRLSDKCLKPDQTPTDPTFITFNWLPLFSAGTAQLKAFTSSLSLLLVLWLCVVHLGYYYYCSLVSAAFSCRGSCHSGLLPHLPVPTPPTTIPQKSDSNHVSSWCHSLLQNPPPTANAQILQLARQAPSSRGNWAGWLPVWCSLKVCSSFPLCTCSWCPHWTAGVALEVTKQRRYFIVSTVNFLEVNKCQAAKLKLKAQR